MTDRARSRPRPAGPVPPLFAWLFRNRHTGRITVVQFPNVALWLFLVTIVVRRIPSTKGTTGTAVEAIGAAALSWWALDEIWRGVNPWRRLLGMGAATAVVVGLVMPW